MPKSWSEMSEEMPSATTDWSQAPCIHHARFVVVSPNSHDLNSVNYIWGLNSVTRQKCRV